VVADWYTPTRRWLIAGAVAAGLVLALALVLGLADIVGSPGVAATCTKLLELAEIAGETPDDADRATCEDRYTTVRAQRGAIGWAKLSRCLVRARTIPDAGSCR
jgi:hypothetical protein